MVNPMVENLQCKGSSAFFRFTIYVTNTGQIEQSPNTTKVFDRPGYGGPTTVLILNCISGVWAGPPYQWSSVERLAWDASEILLQDFDSKL